MRNAYQTGAKIYLSEKNILGLGALQRSTVTVFRVILTIDKMKIILYEDRKIPKKQ